MKNLVDYSSSENSDEEKKQYSPGKNHVKELPMLLDPAIKNVSKSVEFRPDDHEMRKRSFEHIEGKTIIFSTFFP